jgi:uncharacterized membrane protein required for colicin V production
MTVLDWALLAVWLGIALSGFWKGAVRIVFGIGGLIAGLWLALAVGGDAAALLGRWLGAGWIAATLGRLMPAVACVALCLVAGWGIDRTLQELHLGWLNRLAGALLAAGAGLILLAVLLGSAARVSPAFREASERSWLASRLVRTWERVVGPQADEAGASSGAADGGGISIGR